MPKHPKFICVFEMVGIIVIEITRGSTSLNTFSIEFYLPLARKLLPQLQATILVC